MAPGRSLRTISSPEAVGQQLRAIVGPEHLRSARPTDAVAGVPAKLVVEPGTEREVSAVLHCANDAGLAVIPRGGGTKLDWGNPPLSVDLILLTRRLSRIEHAWADLTVIVEAGCTFGHLQSELARCGQRLAIDPLWPETATIGGLLSSNDSGAIRLAYGGLRDLVIGSTLALADGTLASSGGKVVKNVAGYDLSKLATGSFGTLGVITRAIFRLHPLPRITRALSFSTEDATDMQRCMLAIQDSTLGHVALELRFSSDSKPAAYVLLEGTEAGIAAQERKLGHIVTPAMVSQSSDEVWSARQQLFSDVGQSAVAKMGILPTDVAKTTATIARMAENSNLPWSSVVQATGIGWLRLRGEPAALRAPLNELRDEIERDGGSFVVLKQSTGADRVEVWGSTGNTASLMRTLKNQFDPKGTLNPGRFVGGI